MSESLAGEMATPPRLRRVARYVGFELPTEASRVDLNLITEEFAQASFADSPKRVQKAAILNAIHEKAERIRKSRESDGLATVENA
jgi:hypothetical protein